MSLELPRLPPTPPTHNDLQIWWQKVCEAIEAQEAIQDQTIADLQETQAELAATQVELTAAQAALEATQATLTATQADLATAQADLATTQADLATTVADLAATQAEVVTVQGQITTLDGQVVAIQSGGPYVVQNVGANWTNPTGTADRSTYATYVAPVMGISYSQADVQALANAVSVIHQRVKAVIDDLKTNGALT